MSGKPRNEPGRVDVGARRWRLRRDAGRGGVARRGGPAGHGERGVVHQQVDGTERGTCFVDEAVDVVLVGEVGADRDRAAAVGLDGGDGFVDGARQPLVEDLLGACDHRDGGALACEEACHRLADPAAGAGDDRDPPVESSHHRPVLRAVGERGVGEEADHVGLDVRRDEAGRLR